MNDIVPVDARRPTSSGLRVLAVADTDSYLKWGAATLDAMPATWSTTQVVVDNPVRPSAAQMAAATDRHVRVVPLRTVLRIVRDERPDVVLLACTGPVVAALTSARVLSGPQRPVLLTGLPGISVPATRRALQLRSRCDLMLLHSHREVAEHSAKARPWWPDLRFGLARLPFLPAQSAPVDVDRDGDLVFAAQAKFPVGRVERERILDALACVPRPVVKLRALAGEEQTHRETWSYVHLRDELVASGRADLTRIRLVGGPMREALDDARGLATVSSTAALEAMALGLPVLLLSDFGVEEALSNVVFEGSGCFGTLDDLRAGRLTHPERTWLEENYFHPPAESTWLRTLGELVQTRRTEGLPVRPRRRSRGGLRRWARLAVPARLRRILRSRTRHQLVR